MSGILQTCVKYHEKAADFQDGDCLVPKVLKDTGAIMSPYADLIVYFDLCYAQQSKTETEKGISRSRKSPGE